MTTNKNSKKTNTTQKKSNSAAMKLGIIAGVVVLLFAAIIFLTNQSNKDKKALAMDLYGTDDLEQATLDQLSDKHYQNIILPDALDEKIKSGEGTFAYLFSPTCVHCQKFTPKLMPLAEKNDIQIDQLNVLEFTDAWVTYNIEATPTLIYFENGEEVNRLVGDANEDVVQQFFDEVTAK